MNIKAVEKIFRVIFIFVFVMGTVWVPTSHVGASPLAQGNGLHAEYRDLGGTEVILTVHGEGPINHGWNGSCPDANMYQNQCGSWAGMFNASSALEETLTGYIEAPMTGHYIFQGWIDDYLELTVNGINILAEGPGGASYLLEIDMVEGDFYPITMHFKNRWGSADVGLGWARPDSVNEIVPRQYLYTELPNPVPELTLEKSASPTTYSQAGDGVNYTYLLTNTGTATLTGPFTVSDDKTTATCPGNVTPVSLNNTVLFDHFENGNVAEYTSGTPAYVSGPSGFGQSVDMSSGAWMRYPIPGWYQWTDNYDPSGKAGSVDFWIYPRQYNVGLINLNWYSTYTPPPAGHILHIDLDANGKLYGGAWSAITAPALTPLPAGNTTIPLNQWTHVAYSWGPDGTRLFVNGVQDAFSPDNHYPALNSSNYLYVPNWGTPEIGYLDELRITSSSQTNFGTLSLAPTEATTCFGGYTIAQSDIDYGSVTNAAQAHGFFDGAPVDSNQDTATVIYGDPWLEVWYPEDDIQVVGWPLNTTVSLTIDNDFDINNGVLYQNNFARGTDDRINIDLSGVFDIGPGHVIAVSDAHFTRFHQVTTMNVTGWNLAADTVFGTAEPNSSLQIHAKNSDTDWVFRTLVTDGSGSWVADFSQPGVGESEQALLDIRFGTFGAATQWGALPGEGGQTHYAFDLPTPNISVHPDEDWLEGYDWPAGVTVDISIDDPATPNHPDFTGSAVIGTSSWNPSANYFSMDLRNIFDIKAGFLVSVTDGQTTKDHEVTNLIVMNADATADTVSGTANPNVHLRVDIFDTNVSMEIDSDSNGNWTADFTGQYDLTLGTRGRVQESDSDWDNTGDDWSIPNPNFSARKNENQIHGYEWTLGSSVTLTIDDPGNGVGTDFTATQTVGVADWNPNQTFVRFDLGSFTLQSGQLVTMSQGGTIKTHTVTNLTVTAVDPVADTVSGTADPGTQVDVGHIYCDQNGCVGFRRVTADTNGNWLADFAHVGEDSDEQDIVDINAGTNSEARQCDNDGECTTYNWSVPNPSFAVRANDNQVEGWEWTLDTTITITVDDPGTPLSPDVTKTAVVYQPDWNPSERRFDLDMNGVFDIKPGDVVTATDGTTLKTHTVTALAFTDINIDTDVVTGVAQAGSSVGIWTCDYANCYNYDPDPVTGGDGVWSVDFTALYNIAFGTWIDSSQSDNDGDSTMYRINVSLPFIEVSPGSHWVHARGSWPDGTLINMTIDDPNTPQPVDYSADATFGQNPGNPGDSNDRLADFDMGSFNLEAGQTITMIGGGITKTYTIQSLEMTGYDLDADTISGVGISGHSLQVCVNNMLGNCSRHITVGSGGNWMADYHNPGARSDEQDTTDIHLASSGWVADYEEDGDQTWVDWIVTLSYATVTSINRMDANPTSAASVRFSVSFSKPVTGVDVSDFSLTPTGIAGAAITDVTGSLTDYTVTVNTGTGTGTLRLNLIDDDSIIDGNGDPLAGLYSYNGSFATGQAYSILPSGGALPRTETLYFNGQQWDSVACWNPYSSNCNNMMAIVQQDNARVTVWETPYIFNMITGEEFPLLADGPYTWNPARTEITFTVKAAATWSDGTPLTAYDVAYTWATNVKYGTGVGSGYQDYIDTIEALDAHTVRVKAKLGGDGKAINPLMVSGYLSTNYVIQKSWTQMLEERSGYDANILLNDSGEDFVASGPYLKFLSDDTKVVLMRDDNYWGKDGSMWGTLPAPKYLAHVIYADDAAGLNAFKAGEVDVSQQFIANVQDLWLVDHLPVSTYYPDAPYHVASNLPTAYYNLNSYGLDQVAVRKAIAMAVNYESIIAEAMTNQSPTFTQVPRSIMNPTPNEQALYDQAAVAHLQWTGNDIIGANALLDAAGIVDTNGDGWREYNGQKLSYVATCPNGWTDWQAAIELLASVGDDIGIEITTNYPEWSVYQTVVTNSRVPFPAGYDIFMMWTTGSGPTSPWARARLLMSSEWVNSSSNWNGNWGNYVNPAVDALLQAISSETDPIQLKADFTELTRIYLTDVPSFALMYRPQNFHTVNESIWKNFPHDGDGTNPPVPPLDLTDGYSIAGLYNLAQQDFAPVAVDDVYSVAKNMELTVTAENGVLANDLDADALTAIKVTDPASGALVLHPDGSFLYIPDLDYKGTDTFTYRVSDGDLISNVGIVTIHVGTGTPPVIPSSFYGEIHINDDPPVVDNVVEAFLPGDTVPAAVTTVGIYQGVLSYGMDVPGESTSEGAPVTFKINGRVVATSVWHSGTNIALNFHPPQAIPGGPYWGEEGTAIQFTGSASDWAGDASVYQWDWNNDGTYDETGIAPIHTWNQLGEYTVGLKLMDAQHGEGAATFTVTVTDVLPTNVSAGGPYNATSGQSVTLNGSAMCASVDTCIFEWDLNNDGVYDDAIGTSAIKTWFIIGDYTVGLKVTDNDGNAATATTVVHVTPLIHSVALVSGWNLVSFNVHPMDTTIAAVLSSISGKYDLVYAWDATGAHSSSGNWLKADTIPMSQDSLTDLNETMGFWIHMNSASTLRVSGSMPTATSISILDNASGWNLVGYPTVMNGALPNALSDLGTDFSLVYAYHANETSDPWKLFDRSAPPFVSDLQFLSPGWGYWIKVTADHDWNVVYAP